MTFFAGFGLGLYFLLAIAANEVEKLMAKQEVYRPDFLQGLFACCKISWPWHRACLLEFLLAWQESHWPQAFSYMEPCICSMVKFVGLCYQFLRTDLKRVLCMTSL